ncbi:MAG: HDOD domain-containing protein [Nitrospirota bacterium]|nr:HDOD domain-containing protein [Nitrospirota bacterium]MDP2383000.1 HDOD domain-containing protein [Nitrospirota bacterium]MDP3595361.1 HDOD domain-containing protein [Nitrospirota bacterium]
MSSAQELVRSCSNIFTLPEIYLRVRDVVDAPQSTMDDLADALKIDPAISARLLRIVNSPLYGFPKQIDTVTRAVNLIGMQAVSDLVAASTIGRTFTGMTSNLMDLSAYWHKSVLCALMAGKIAKASGIEDSERFFIAGLLRDIGHLVLYQTVPQRAQSALVEAGNLSAPLAEVEQANIGCDFTEVGAELIRFWSMPSQIEQSIRHQLSPNEAGEFTLHASIVHLAGATVDHAELVQAKASQPPAFDAFALACTQFKADKHPALLKEAQAQLQDTLACIYPLAKAA